MRTLIASIILALASVGASADGGPRRPPPETLVTHNGSLMAARPHDDDHLQIRYVDPRPGLWEVGVRPGTVLIHGQWHGTVLRATAYIFAYHCGPVPYPVSGSVGAGGILVLRGAAPIVDLRSCVVVDAAWTSNSTLVFEPTRHE